MTRPRVAAIISAIAASAAAFLVVSRWGLVGTLTGAAVMPVVYALVSQWSTDGIEHLRRWILRHISERRAIDQPEVAVLQAASHKAGEMGQRSEVGGRRTFDKTPRRGAPTVQWLVVTFAFLALGLSVYAIASSDPGDKTVVREKVVEKTFTVTVTTPAIGHAGGSPSDDMSATTTSLEAGSSTTSILVTTSSSDWIESEAGSAPTTVSTAQIDQERGSTFALDAEPTTATLLR